MKSTTIFKSALILILPMFVTTVFSNVIFSASVSYSDVRFAVSKAVVGDTIQIPAGKTDWGGNTLNVTGGIYLRGAGKNNTIIQRSESTINFVIQFNGNNGKRCTLSDITLQGTYNNDDIYSRGVGFWNGCIDFSVFNCKFVGFADCAVYVGNSLNQRGVIYNNDFIDNYYSAINNLGYGIVVYGDGTWPTLDLGSQNSVFVEDNNFSGNRHNIASNNGSRYVFRFNQVEGQEPTKEYQMTDAHGKSSWPRGSRSYEIYNNNFKAKTTNLQRSAIGIRGGDGVIFNNTCSNNISRTVELWIEGFACDTIYPVSDQIRSLYIWDNDMHDDLGYTNGGITNNCPYSIALNRDYFLFKKPGYTPFVYPHPLH